MPPAQSLASPTAAPRGLRAWRAALREQGGSWAAWLRLHVQAVRRDSPPSTWISLVDERALEERLAQLQPLWDACKGDAQALHAQAPLFGVPFAVKDNIDVAGWPTTAACPAFAYKAAADAGAVRRLLQAGALLLGKTNLDQFATGLVGTRSPYGTPTSTWDASRVSGGSSSGSAVAVARGDVVFALGTDTAGSGRIPAGFNQIVGVKPTPGRVSTAGVVPACRSLDCVSIFALDVADGGEVLATVEGADPTDPFSRFLPGPAAFARPGGRRLRVGVASAPGLDAALGYDLAWAQALERLAAWKDEVEVVELDLQVLHRVGALLYEGPWVAERLHAVRSLWPRGADVFDPSVHQVIAAGEGRTAVDAFDAQYALRSLAVSAQAMFDTVDLLLVPTAPTHPTVADLRAQPLSANAALGHYTNFVNLLGWCALALPAAVTPQGLPFGVTAIAPAGLDAALLDWGLHWQRRGALASGITGWVPDGPDAPDPARPGPAVEPQMPLCVVGAHLSGQPLNHQLVERGARLQQCTHTAPAYRLHALRGTVPPKPGLERVGPGGVAIEVEVWSMPVSRMGSFLQGVPPPLAIGSVELADGRWVQGFVCEPAALREAEDISAHGGWRAWRERSTASASLAAPA